MNFTQHKLITLHLSVFATGATLPFIAVALGALKNINKPRAFSTDLDNSNNLNPVVVYANADTQKELIVKDNQNKSGIYR